ncbi:MAG: HipA domain-containing protein [Rhodospirillaceae bacterium]|nr:HipA domain-containing protein [Rhodospirillaceae bacterium]
MTPLYVHLEGYAGGPVGVLAANSGIGEFADGPIFFAYDAFYLASKEPMPLSISMPLREEPYYREGIAFFENLLPEGSRLQTISRMRGVDPSDTLGLLGEIGLDCPGAISIVSAQERPTKAPGRFPDDYDLITNADLLKLAESGIAPLKTDKKIEFSLAGVQGKAAVLRDQEGRFHLARGGAPSTHIVKLPDRNFAGMVENEAFCLDLARELGLNAIEPKIIELAPDRPALLVERFDRIANIGTLGAIEAGFEIHRLHQEDFCQALGLRPSQKYTRRSGPSAEDLLNIEIGNRARFRIRLLEGLIYNFLIANSDAHAKNYALLYPHGTNLPNLAPLYDLLSIAVYPDYHQGQALAMGAKGRGADVDFAAFNRDSVQRMSERLKMTSNFIEERIERLARAVLPKALALREKNPAYKVIALRVISAIGKQVELLNTKFGFDIPVDVLDVEEGKGGWG